MSRTVILIFIIIIIASAASGFIFYNQLNHGKEELTTVKQRIEVVKKKISNAKRNISNLEKDNTKLGENIFDSQAKLVDYNRSLRELKEKKAEVLFKLQERRITLDSLKEQLATLMEEKEVFQAAFDKTKAERGDINAEIVELSRSKRKIEKEMKAYAQPQKGVELNRIIVKLSEISDGSVIDVNDEYGFAIINIGVEEGVIVGDILGVYRDKELISKVIVEKIFEHMASIIPAQDYGDVELEVSDKVSLIR